jgi:1-phosphofructokinase
METITKVTAVSLNPAIDQTVWINNLQVDAVNRGRAIQFEPGGKGVNVALFLADYTRQAACKFDVAVTGFLGDENAQLFENRFARRGIANHFVRIPGETRISVKIVDEAAQQTTDINMPGLEPSLADVEQLLNVIYKLAADSEWFVLTGSLPPGLPANFYTRIIQLLQSTGRKVILDTSQAALREGISACPNIIKPNQAELQELTGQEIASQADLISTIHQLLQTGIGTVVVSLGEQGALFATPEAILHAHPPRVPVKSTVGAGDALVAGILCAQIQHLDLIDCARLATAFSLSAITSTIRGLPKLWEVQALAGQVEIDFIARLPA